MPCIRVLILKVAEDYINDVLETGHYYSSSLPTEEELSGDFILLGHNVIAAVGRILDIRKITAKDVEKLTSGLAEGYEKKSWEYIYDLEFDFSLPDSLSSHDFELAASMIEDGGGYDAFIDKTGSHTQTFGYKNFADVSDFTAAKNILKNSYKFEENDKFLNLENNINTNIANLRKLHQKSHKQTTASAKAQASAAAAKQAAILKAQLQEANRIQHILDCKPEELKKLYKAGDTYKVKKHNPGGLVKIKVYDAVITDVENIIWKDPTDPADTIICGQKLKVRIDALNEDSLYEVGTCQLVQ